MVLISLTSLKMLKVVPPRLTEHLVAETRRISARVSLVRTKVLRMD